MTGNQQNGRTVNRLVWLFCIVLLGTMTVAQNPPPTRRPPTGLLLDDVYQGHLAGVTSHPERPERLTAIRNGLARSGLMETLYRIAPRRVTDAELMSVHTRAYVNLVRSELSNLRGTRD